MREWLVRGCGHVGRRRGDAAHKRGRCQRHLGCTAGEAYVAYKRAKVDFTKKMVETAQVMRNMREMNMIS